MINKEIILITEIRVSGKKKFRFESAQVLNKYRKKKDGD